MRVTEDEDDEDDEKPMSDSAYRPFQPASTAQAYPFVGRSNPSLTWNQIVLIWPKTTTRQYRSTMTSALSGAPERMGEGERVSQGRRGGLGSDMEK